MAIEVRRVKKMKKKYSHVGMLKVYHPTSVTSVTMVARRLGKYTTVQLKAYRRVQEHIGQLRHPLKSEIFAYGNIVIFKNRINEIKFKFSVWDTLQINSIKYKPPQQINILKKCLWCNIHCCACKSTFYHFICR